MTISGPIVSLWIFAKNNTVIFSNGEDYLLCNQIGRKIISRERANRVIDHSLATQISNPVEIPIGILCAFFPAENLLQIIE